MKVLLLNDFKVGGGAEIIFLKTYDVLKELGHNVDLNYCNEKLIAPTSVFAYIFSVKKCKALLDQLRKEKYDVIYLLNYAYAYSPSILWAIKRYKKSNSKVKVIYNAHDAHLICPNSGLMYFHKQNMCLLSQSSKVDDFLTKTLDHRGHLYSILKKTQWLLAYRLLKLHTVFDKILCPSVFLMDNIKNMYPKKDLYLLRNPLEINNHLVNEQKEKCKSLKLIYFGRLSSEKGLNVLIEKMSELSDSFEFHIYGDGPEKEKLNKLIINLNAGVKIKLKGKLPWTDLMKILPHYHAFILPSSCYENAPLSIVEAATAGLHILTMGYGGMKELAQIVGNHCFIDPISSTSLHEAFQYVKNARFKKPNLAPFSEDVFKSTIASSLK